MTIEDQITALLAKAEPLRCLPDEEAEARGLPAIVDKINALRNMKPGLTAEQKAVARGIEDAYGRKPNPGEVEFFAPPEDAISAESLRRAADAFDGIPALAVEDDPDPIIPHASEAQFQAERKRRGRPPKAKVEGSDA